MKHELPNIKQQPRSLGRGSLLIKLLLAISIVGAEWPAYADSNIKEFEIHLPDTIVLSGKPYQLDGFGSGLALRTVKGDGQINFLTVRDGSNPIIADIKLKNGILEFSEVIAILDGLGQVPDFDTEGISIENKNYAWICEEKLPSAHKLDLNSGRIIESLLPGKQLPDWLVNKKDNRGFEGIALTPSGKLILALQSSFKLRPEEPEFIPLIKYDLKNNHYQVYAYTYKSEEYLKTESVSISDIYALDDNRLLVLEQGRAKDNKYLVRVFIAYLENEITWQGDTFINFNASDQHKVLVSNLTELGWPSEKAEGLTLMPDERSIVISSELGKDRKDLRIWFIKLPKRIAAFKPKRYMLVISMLMPLILIFIAVIFIQLRRRYHGK